MVPVATINLFDDLSGMGEFEIMKRTFLTAVVAAMVFPGVVFAQDLPEPVTALGLTDIQIREKPKAEYGRDVRATLPSGSQVEIELDRDGRIEEIEAKGNALFPVSDVRSLIPQTVLSNSSFPADATLEKIEFGKDGRIELEGRLKDGREFEAEFTRDGVLIELDVD